MIVSIISGKMKSISEDCNKITFSKFTALHTQKAYTHKGTSSPQIPLLSAHAYMHGTETTLGHDF